MSDTYDNQKSEMKFFNRSIFIILVSIVIFFVCGAEYQNRDWAQKTFDSAKELKKVQLKYNHTPFYTENQSLIILKKRNELIKKHIDSLPFFITLGLLLLAYGVFLLVNSRNNVKNIPQLIFIILENILKLLLLVCLFVSLIGDNYHDASFRFADITVLRHLIFCLMFPTIVLISMIILKKTYPTKIFTENKKKKVFLLIFIISG